MLNLHRSQELEIYLHAKGVESQAMEMVGIDERLQHQHSIPPEKGKCSCKLFKLEGNRKAEFANYKTMEEWELEVVTRGIEGLCAMIVAEPAILKKN